jgi:hypothetical protein
MSALQSALRQYVAMRRGLGYKFQHQERRLTDFVAFMDERGTSVITVKSLQTVTPLRVGPPR